MKIVVVGNGVAGEAACFAVRSRRKDVKITLISKDSYPFYSPCILPQYISKEIKKSQIFLKSLADYEREGIDILFGQEVKSVDASKKLLSLDGQEIAYDKLILATGSLPIILGIEGIQKRGVRVFKSLRDADRLLRAQGVKAIVVGSGPIGVELAVALRKRNWEVCLVEALDWILPSRFDEKGSQKLRSVLEKQGIEIVTGEKVLAIEGKRKVKGVVTSKTGEREADMVVLSVGMRPSVELARGAGVEVGALGGIRTNGKMETNVKDIYACGDCVEGRDSLTGSPKLSLLWPHAERQGRVAGCNSIDVESFVRWVPDIVNLDAFGTFAGAIGQPQSLLERGNKIEVLEEERRGYYHCLVIAEGRLVGAQFIGDSESMGVLQPFMGRGYDEICRQIEDDGSTARFPWYFFARNFFH